MLSRDYPDAYQPLLDRLGLSRGIPFTEHWSAGADCLTLISDHCLQARPRLILECSSGLSTLILARCCQISGVGQVLSLENGPQYARAVREDLHNYGLGEFARVLDAPLVDTPLGERLFQWYSLRDLPQVTAQFLVIDGPPGYLQAQSRYPALPMLMSRLAPGAHIYLDDAARDDEQELLEEWLARYPGLACRHIDTERGCAVVQLP